MKLIKTIILIELCLIALLYFSAPVYAETLTLPNGQELNIDNLTDYEITQAIETARKSMSAKKASESVMNIVQGVDPTELEAWSKLISGTIKTVCEDLSITVNDFVKTPVGIGVAALIAYRVAGEELLDNALDIVIMVPLWFMMTGIILFLGWYFFSGITVYDYDNGKKLKHSARRVSRFPWKNHPESSNDMAPKTFFAGILIACQIVGTVLTLMIVLG